MKKFLALLLAVVMVVSMAALAGCANTAPEDDAKDSTSGTAQQSGETTQDSSKKVKIGFIFLHDENSTYDKNFLDAAQAACEATGAEIILKKNVPETSACYEAACDLADAGCSAVFADSFGHESFMLQAAKEYPQVQFCHATGTMAHTEKLDNFHNAFASIYEGRYLAGIAAGMKLNEMIAKGDITAEQAVVGYVGAFTYAEVISGYTSFFLGIRSVCESATMKVKFTGSWYDEAKEKEAANALIQNEKCVLISQHADSMGAPTACENANVPNVSYNGSTVSACPNTFIVSSRIDWTPYMTYMINCVKENKAIDTDSCYGLKEGAVVLTEVNEKAAAAGTQDAIDAAMKQLEEGTLKVFDISKFTVEGKELSSYMADVDTDAAYTPDTEVVSDGYFHESEFRSAPYFAVQIDGITLLDTNYGSN